MRKFALIAAMSLLLTGCKNSTVLEAWDPTDILTDESGREIYPNGMCDGGKEVFGDGKTEDDILTQVENWIWGDGE